VRFAVQQWVDAMSPSNYLALNPEAIRKAVESNGESIALGVRHLVEDMQQGHLSQTDESVFEVGRNVATTAGAIVYENDRPAILVLRLKIRSKQIVEAEQFTVNVTFSRSSSRDELPTMIENSPGSTTYFMLMS